MATVTSRDGTTIGYTRQGQGPALVIVDGALCYRAFGPSCNLARALSPYFTVYTYDRRGRGESEDGASSSVGQEVEDLEAVVTAAGGSAYLYGISSGAALALEAATRIPGVTRLALYEAPFIVDDAREPVAEEYWAELARAARSGEPSLAVTMFMKMVGAPGLFVLIMRLMPMWSKLKAVAHTLPNDGALVRDYQQGRPLPAGRWSGVRITTLVMDGGRSPAWMRNAMKALSAVLPDARYQTLPGQTHMVKPEAQLQPLRAFFGGALL